MSSRAARRPGRVRVVAVPDDLDELDGALSGLVGLPTRMFWSGPTPGTVRWDFSDPDRRRDLYEIVLTQGDLDTSGSLSTVEHCSISGRTSTSRPGFATPGAR